MTGNVEAQFKLGEVYEYRYKQLGLPDAQKAVYWYSKSAEQNHAEAKYRLGLLYYFDKYKMQDYAKAKTFFEEAAAQEHYHAQELLGDMYCLGLGVKKDLTKAAYWYEKAGENAANDRLDFANYTYDNIAFFYHNYMNDKVRAKYWYEKAAAAGNYSAKTVLEKEF